ncbi:tetratricopeptide repeat protein [Nocardiopsis sp. N85]|uniref:AfsR/SARP family transcriptional regulator n=1 Tax=Nocardiopsis sp. N85 TaxID=3029400 RepID=UPI00237F4DA4|nr:tetratricopeptide repeat protein [Nocardiopsis sp. N85]MDE3721416.1 tetratricopeptide repeat protein [Nocardiopsis sp. N85]
MRLRLLGSIRLGEGDHEITLGTGKERTLLVCLALAAPAPLPLETLAERLWDDHPPTGYRATLHTYITRLRRTIIRAGGDRRTLLHTPEGYLLRLPAQDTDWGLFTRLCSRARALSSTSERRTVRACLEKALELWAGDPIPEVTGQWAERTRLALRQAHQDALAAWAHLAAQDHDHADIVGVLGAFLPLYPSDEVLHTHHIRALHTLGRTADALAVYHRLKDHLAEHLGVDPSREARRLFAALLASTTEPTEPPLARSEPHVGMPASPVRDNLPQDPAHFHGRTPEALLLTTRLTDPNTGTAATWVISGMPGIGKTVLALHAAHRVKNAFPHTRLYLDLRGHHDRLEPLSIDDALIDLLRLARFPADRIPRTRAERIAVWREHTRTLRALIVLDDASDTDQVLPLLPAGDRCATLITTRRRLPDLDGAEHLPLRPPSTAECATIFSIALGRDIAQDEADTVQEIIDRCERLPLVVRLAATTARLNPTWSLTDVLHSIPTPDVPATAGFRLGAVDLSSLFATTLAALHPDHRYAFLQLGLHPTRTVSEPIAAALIDHHGATGALAALVDAHLVDEPRPGRFAMHALVSAYSHHTALDQLSSTDIDAARHRMYQAYLDTARRADHTVYPHRPGRDDHENALPVQPWDETRALDWLRDETPALTVILSGARTHGHQGIADALTHTLSGHIDARGPWHHAPALHNRLTRPGAEGADPRSRARAHFDRARALLRLRRTEEALGENTVAHRLWSGLEDHLGRAWAVAQEGMILYVADSYEASRSRFDEALELFEACVHRPGIVFSLRGRGLCHFNSSAFHEAVSDFTDATTVLELAPDLQLLTETHINLAGAYHHLGYHHQAWALCERALGIARRRGDEHKVALTLGNMSEIALHRGDPEQAIRCLEQALVIFQGFGDRWALATALSNLGVAENTAGRPERARTYFRRSLALGDALSPSAEVTSLIGIAELETGDPHASQRSLRRALEIAQRHGLRKERAQALYALGELLNRQGGAGDGLALLQQAADLFGELRAPETQILEALIEALKRPVE